MKKILFLCIGMILIMTNLAFADTLDSEGAIRVFTDTIMEKVAAGDFDAAFEMIKPYILLSSAEVDSVLEKTKSLRDQYGSRYGKSTGYAYLDSKKVGKILLRLRYVEQTNRHALPWVFYFYKSEDGWILNSFDWNDIYKDLFEK